MTARKLGLETAKFIYGLVVGCMVFLFFCLLLDIFCWAVAGGWNPLLVSWPIFSGSVSSVAYGHLGTTVSLVLGMGVVARIILWDRLPVILDIWRQPTD